MLAIIGGSGLYEFEGLEGIEWVKVSTPFGNPSDEILTGTYAGFKVAFLPRHARGHKILPGELNHRANIWALKSLGTRFIVSVSAVGSLKEEYRPLDIVLPDQFLDRTKKSLEHTFFGNGIVVHVSFGDPIAKELQQIVYEEARKVFSSMTVSLSGGNTISPKVHVNGTYVNMEGPAFSTRAESNMYRQLNCDIIGMTNLPEAKLAREAEIAYASMAMVTDYDCWKTDEEPVTGELVLQRLQRNAATAKNIIKNVIPKVPFAANWTCHESLKSGLITPKHLWPAETVEKLKPILTKYLT
jgi:5'-methylthioadenosine phosphorylase